MGMRVLITGASGLIGSHLCDFLLSKTNFELYAIELPRIKPYRPDDITYFKCDITDSISVIDVFREVKPDIVYHLAGQSFFDVGRDNPQHTLNINVIGTMNILEAIRRQGSIPKKIIVASSASIYGIPNHIPTNEDEPMKPLSIYGVSKVSTDRLAYQYFKNYDLPITTIRPFIIVGSRQQIGNSINSFASQIAEIEKVGKGIIKIGNLSTSRDFTDVRDCVNGIWKLTNEGINGEAYNICSGISRKMEDVLNQLLKLSSAEISVEIDKDKLRPSDSPIECGSNHKLNSLTGWIPECRWEDTLEEILNYWRK